MLHGQERGRRRGWVPSIVVVWSLVIIGFALPAAATPGANVWTKRYNGPANGADSAAAVAVSPDGSKVFVTGASVGSTASQDYATVAYNATSGAVLWTKRYNGADNKGGAATAVAVSPDGSKVFVTGASVGSTTGDDYATVAYNATTGALLWSKRYDGPAHGYDYASALAVSSDGSKVFATGTSEGSTTGQDYATVAYNATTGALLWTKRYNGPTNGWDGPNAIAVGHAGAVFVTGGSPGTTTLGDFTTIAYNTTTGARLWIKRYNVPGGNGATARAVGVSPDSTKVFVTGQSVVSATENYSTVAYDAKTGTLLWAKQYAGPTNYDFATALTVGPGGGRIFVTGTSIGSGSGEDYATIAYSATTGAVYWTKRFTTSGNNADEAKAAGVSPDGTKVFVTGTSAGPTANSDYATVAYSASSGAVLWTKRYNGAANGNEQAAALRVAPHGNRLFVTGTSAGATGNDDYATVAYATS
jgi:outer membrane protein assembly factor BamB